VKKPKKPVPKPVPSRLTGEQLALLKTQYQQFSKRGPLEDRARAKAVVAVIHEVEKHRIEEARREVLEQGAKHFAGQFPHGL
jgi:hypothetical protein